MLIYTLVASFLWLPLHELGHYAAARHFGFKPKVEYTPFEVRVRLMKPDNELFERRREVFIIGFMGIVGVLPMLPLIFTAAWIPVVVLTFYSVFEVVKFKFQIRKYLQQKEKRHVQ